MSITIVLMIFTHFVFCRIEKQISNSKSLENSSGIKIPMNGLMVLESRGWVHSQKHRYKILLEDKLPQF